MIPSSRILIRANPESGPIGSRVTSIQTDVVVRMGLPFADGSRATVEFWTNMKVEGEEMTLCGCLLLDFDDTWLCRRLREYWNITPGRQDPTSGWGE